MLIDDADDILLCGLIEAVFGGLGDEEDEDEEDDDEEAHDIAIRVLADLAAFAIAAFMFADDIRLVLLRLGGVLNSSLDGFVNVVVVVVVVVLNFSTSFRAHV